MRNVKDQIVYQIYPRSFMDSNGDGIGDIPGVISQLDYLQDLGINAIWLSPIYESPCDDNGYDISNYQSILSIFGTMDDFDRLVTECKKRDIDLIMDLVVNHSSDEHMWFNESKKSRNNPYSDYYHWADTPNDWLSVFGGSAWEWCESRQQYYLHIFSKKQPDLNWSNKKLVKEIVDMINWWMDKGVDGFRIDAISFLEKPNNFNDLPNEKVFATIPCNNEIIGHNYIKTMMKSINDRGGFSVGEINAIDENEILKYTHPDNNEFQMSIVFVPPEIEVFHDDLIGYYKDIIKRRITLQNNNSWDAVFLSNHDKPRQVSLYGNDTQYWKASAKMLAVLNLTQFGTPFLYQGEEIGMTNYFFENINDYDDIDTLNKYQEHLNNGLLPQEALDIVKLSSRDNARTPMQWTAENNAGFTTGTPWLKINKNKTHVNVATQRDDHTSILQFYKQLISFRKSSECMKTGLTKLLPSSKNTIIYQRYNTEDDYLIILNLHTETEIIDHNISKYSLIFGEMTTNSIAPFGFAILKR